MLRSGRLQLSAMQSRYLQETHLPQILATSSVQRHQQWNLVEPAGVLATAPGSAYMFPTHMTMTLHHPHVRVIVLL